MLANKIVLTFQLLLQEVTAGPIIDSLAELEADVCFLPSQLGFVEGSFGRRKFLEDCDGLGDISLVVMVT